MRLSTRVEPDWSGRCACSQTASHSAIARITGSRKSFACGLVNRIRSIPSPASTARPRSPASEPVAEVRDRPRPERDVDERVALEDPLTLGLGVTATDGDHALRVAVLQRLRLREVSGETLVRLLTDRARVEDDDVS